MNQDKPKPPVLLPWDEYQELLELRKNNNNRALKSVNIDQAYSYLIDCIRNPVGHLNPVEYFNQRVNNNSVTCIIKNPGEDGMIRFEMIFKEDGQAEK